MKNIALGFLSLVLIGQGCLGPQNETEIGGTITVGRFSGTEMACMPEIGESTECNSGSVVIGSEWQGKTYWFNGYTCDAVEVVTGTDQGIETTYKTSNCTAGLIPGDSISLMGDVEIREDQWYDGVQQDESWVNVLHIQ